MAQAPRVLAFAGSLRAASWNKKVLALAVAGARAAGGEVTVVDLKDHALPLYDGDLEERDGLPPAARRLKALFLEHQGLLIAAPEYNSSLTGVLKNTIDWVSRSAKGEAPLACFDGKVAALLSASPGALGGLRGLFDLRAILQNIRVMVMPAQVAVPKVHEAMGPDGRLADGKQQAAVEKLGADLVALLRRLHG
jgi:NAD(P)H-dependent FMN reductase